MMRRTTCIPQRWLTGIGWLGAALVLTTFITPVRVEAATTRYAASPSYTDVAAAVSSASPGDTVVVPAGSGSVTWSNALTLTRGIWLQGPGRDSLTITRAGTMINIAPSSTAIANNETIKVSGFTFNCNDSDTHAVTVTGPSPAAQGTSWITTKQTFKGLAFINNRIKNISGGGYSFAITVTGQVRGVIGGNDFDRCSAILGLMGGEGSSMTTAFDVWDAFGPSRAFGTADNLYFEDNTIRFSSAFTPADPAWTEIGQSGRVVMRYNSWNMTNATGGGVAPEWDIHGMQNWNTPPGQTGTLITEYYGNTITAGSGYRWANFRGGWALGFNNIWTGSSAPTIQVVNYNGNDAYTGRPGTIANSYFWNNTGNGSARPAVVGDASGYPGSVEPVENTDFYNLNTSFNGTTQHGVGRASTAPVTSCNAYPRADANGQQIGGDGYWVAPTATPTVDPAVIQAGRLYKCIGGSWQVYYTPYTYPHPLRATAASAPPPTAPTAVVVR